MTIATIKRCLVPVTVLIYKIRTDFLLLKYLFSCNIS